MSQTWHFLINPFLVLAKKNLKKFYKLTYLFMQALYAQQSDPTILGIYNNLHDPYIKFRDAYVDKKSKVGIRKGDTGAQTEIFKKLYQKMMPDWNRKIELIFPPETTEYKKIFSDGMTPLSRGSLEERLTYFKAIILTMKNYSSLDTIRADMEAFLSDIEALRGTRAQSGTNADIIGTQLHTLAEALAVEEYGALGLLINLFKETPEKILDFVSVQLLRRPQHPDELEDEAYEMQLAPGETKAADFVFTLNEKLMVYNSGNTTLRFFFVKTVGDPMPTSYFDLEANAVKEFFVNAYANTSDRLLMVKNLSDAEAGSAEIEKAE